MNNELLDTYQLKSLDGLLEYDINDYKVVKQGGQLYLRENQPPGRQWEEYDNDPLLTPYDKIIRCLGFQFDSSIFRKYDGSSLRIDYWKLFSLFQVINKFTSYNACHFFDSPHARKLDELINIEFNK